MASITLNPSLSSSSTALDAAHRDQKKTCISIPPSESCEITDLAAPLQGKFSIHEYLDKHVICKGSTALKSNYVRSIDQAGEIKVSEKGIPRRLLESVALVVYSVLNLTEAVIHSAIGTALFCCTFLLYIGKVLGLDHFEAYKEFTLKSKDLTLKEIKAFTAALCLAAINLTPFCSTVVDHIANRQLTQPSLYSTLPHIDPAAHPQYINVDLVDKAAKLRSTSQRIYDKIHRILTEAWFVVSYKIKGHLFSPKRFWIPGEPNTWRPGNKGLIVMPHGLNGDPAIFYGHADKIEEERPDIEVRLPKVTDLGNCSLAKAAQPIVDMVIDYIQHNPGKPVCLIGVSNGSRIAAYVELALRELGYGSAIKVCCIAGPFFGSQVVDQLINLGIAQKRPVYFHTEIAKDFTVGAVSSAAFIDRIKGPVPVGREICYEFLSTLNDQLVPNISSSLPLLGPTETLREPQQIVQGRAVNGIFFTHQVVYGQGHSGVVKFAKENGQLERCYSWIDSHQPQSIIPQSMQA